MYMNCDTNIGGCDTDHARAGQTQHAEVCRKQRGDRDVDLLTLRHPQALQRVKTARGYATVRTAAVHTRGLQALVLAFQGMASLGLLNSQTPVSASFCHCFA
jgi:hypothetical protein